MLRSATACALALLALVALRAPASHAQTATVETVVPAGSDIDDGLALGPDGALYGSRFGGFPVPIGDTVTRVELPGGATSVYADGFARANGLAFDTDGTLYVANYNTGAVTAVAPNGTTSNHAQATSTVSGVLYDDSRKVLYVASYDGQWVREFADGAFTDVVTNDGIVSADSLNGPAGLAQDTQGRLYVANFNDGKLFRIDGGDLVLLAQVPSAIGFLTFGGERLFATGISSHVVYEISLAGDVAVLAGTGEQGTADGPGSTARFNRPNGIAATASGDTLYVSQVGDRAVRRIVRTVETSSEAAGAAAGHRLYPPAPNPVRDATVLRFRLEAPAEVELVLSDVLGRRLRVLAAGLRPSGEHTVALPMHAVSAGVYFVTLRAGATVETHRLVRR